MASDSQYEFGRMAAAQGEKRAWVIENAVDTAEALRGYDAFAEETDPQDDPPAPAGETQAEKIARLEAWVADLQNGGYVNCVYCGMRYGEGPDAAVALEPALKAHVEQCPEHPLAKLTARLPAVFAAGYRRGIDRMGGVPPTDVRLREFWEEVRESVLSGEG